MMGKNFENPWGKATKKGTIRSMASLLDSGVFPGTQGGPLEHIIAAKAVAFGEALTPGYKTYMGQVIKNADAMANAFVDKGYHLISKGTDNHSMLIDLRSKNISGKDAEIALGKADITLNKNMVPFDDKSPFVTSGIRIGTPAITTRGLLENEMGNIVELMDSVIMNPESDAIIKSVKEKVNGMMTGRSLFAQSI